MFIDENILCRMMKEAYKGIGLRVARSTDRLYMSGGHWRWDCIMEFIPNKVKGKIVELCGELPGVHECFDATKGGNQMVTPIETEVPESIYGEDGNTMNILTVTDVIITVEARMQRVMDDEVEGILYLLNNDYYRAVSPASVLADKGESQPEGPFVNRGAFWENNVSKFEVYFRTDDIHKRLMKGLGMIDLKRDPVEGDE